MRANAAAAAAPTTSLLHRRSDVLAIALLMLGVSLIYGARLGRQPLVGEETRWATAAREMLSTGDWIVPRQQGQVFPERPPMTIWAIAAAGLLRGEVDSVAVRLPSVVAIVLTSVLVYTYARLLLSQSAALAAGMIYATIGQVLQIGRLGESEALFALLVSASLLVWHIGYLRAWPPLVAWSIGFGISALAALVKGPQAPVYFVAITAVYLMVRRDWRYLVRWQYAAGAAVFVAIIAAWQIPFYLATDWQAVVATWSGLAGDRFHIRGVLVHAGTYPLETFACLLPWSPFLVALARHETRALLVDRRPVTTFLLVALVVAYPTVWLAAGARGRYFMPLYPLVAVLIGLVIDRSSMADRASYPRRAWHQFLLLWGSTIALSALVIGGASLFPIDLPRRFYQPRGFGLLYAMLAAGAVYSLWITYRRPNQVRPLIAIATIAGVAAMAAVGLMVNLNTARWSDPTSVVAEFRNQLPAATNLVSLGPIEHRFAYYYEEPIAELDWPLTPSDLPPSLDYFCFMRHRGDTPAARQAGRGRSAYTTPGTVPFAWQEIASICVERRVSAEPAQTVVLGRILRPVRAVVSDVTVPQRSTARHPAASPRK